MLSDFLSEKKLVNNNIEAMRISNSLHSAGYVEYDKFLTIFLKPILKSGLANLAVGLQKGEFSGKDSTLAMKLFRCQRKFMIHGITQKTDEISLQGKKALQALGKYQSQNKAVSRSIAMAKAKDQLDKEEDDEIFRLKGYLYKINEHAQEFVDPHGRISTKLRNTWDIRDQINEKEKILDVTPDIAHSFNKETYFHMLEYVPRVDVIKIPKNVKLFRENFLLERFRKAAAKNESFRNYNNFSAEQFYE